MFERLKRRRDFLAAQTGRKSGRRSFVVQSRPRGDDGPPRFGFTVSKRTAQSAVERNRIRRRLREAVRLAGADKARPGHDYVVVGRRAALSEPFAHLAADLAQAMADVSAGRRRSKDGESRSR